MRYDIKKKSLYVSNRWFKNFLYDHLKTCFSGLDPSLETSYKKHFGENWGGADLNMDCILGDIKELILILFSEILSF